MQSSFDPTIPPSQRLAEAADSKMGIRRDEEQARPQKEQKEKKQLLLPEDVYDQANVGIQPLIDFLQSFLKTIAETGPDTPTVSNPVAFSTPQPTMPTESTNSIAARAASAYQHSQHAQSSSGSSGLDGSSAGTAAAQSLLASTEVRQIHALLAKLNDLKTRGISSLSLARADSFLNSLHAAADQALAASAR